MTIWTKSKSKIYKIDAYNYLRFDLNLLACSDTCYVTCDETSGKFLGAICHSGCRQDH